jgi:hypothetical protein
MLVEEVVQHIRPLKVEELEELEGAVRVQMSILLLQMEVVILVVGEEQIQDFHLHLQVPVVPVSSSSLIHHKTPILMV